MMPVDGIAAANTMLAAKTWRQGYCLEAVWSAYSKNGAQDLNGKSDPTAYAAWLNSKEEDRRNTDYADIPAGVPVYFGPKSSSSAGDIVISYGGGWCIATDIPGHPGTIGKMKLADRQSQIQRPYLGWTTSILDYPISFSSTSGGEDVTVKDDGMTQSVNCNGNLYAVGEEFISHYATTQEADITCKVTSATDEWHELNLSEFTSLLDGLGIPRDVLDANGNVLNPQSNKFEHGGVWSRRREAVALLQKIK